ncbi:hypothetical protein ACE6H2_017259 [Prunus campanulata]
MQSKDNNASMKNIDNCVVQHIYTEKNYVADCLASWSYNVDLEFYVFATPPVWVSSILTDDVSRVTRTRLVYPV